MRVCKIRRRNQLIFYMTVCMKLDEKVFGDFQFHKPGAAHTVQGPDYFAMSSTLILVKFHQLL